MNKFLFGVNLNLVTNICIYGYSFTILLPLLFICVAPYEIVKLAALGYGLAASIVFLVYNMYKAIEDQPGKSKYIVLGLIVVFQIVLYFVLKFYFFSHISKEDYEHNRIKNS